MSEYIKFLLSAGFLLSSVSLPGWAKYSSQSTAEPASQEVEMSQGFPLNKDQQWFVTESYLLWRPFQDGIDYANHVNQDGTKASGHVKLRISLEKVEPQWYSGARLAIGKYLANHDAWDVSIVPTYFYSNEKGKSAPNEDKGTYLTPALTNGTLFEKGSAFWRLNYFTCDLSLGREYRFVDTIIAHPYFGLRGTFINQKLRAILKQTEYFEQSGIVVSQVVTSLFSGRNNFWGIGPRGGSDFQFIFQNQWSFLGGISAAIFLGQSRVKESVEGDFSVGASGISLDLLTLLQSKDKRYCVRTNVEGYLGLGWETWMKNHTVRIAPSFRFEGSKWFGTNKFYRITTQITDGRRHGNLSLMGFSFNLQVDF